MDWLSGSKIYCLAVVVLVLGWQGNECSAAVISIDFSNEWLKIALVKPGVPMEIVLNKESKRKTAAVVALRNDERLFGDAAMTVGIKYPKLAYWYIQYLLGVHYDHPIVDMYKKWFPYYNIKKDPERGTVLFQHDDETEFSPEELVGMLLNYARGLAEDYAGIAIKDAIIIIPAFFNQAQRRAMIHSGKLVGLNVLQLMTDGAAVALNYGVFRQSTFNATPVYIMLYDMGATSTTATIVEFKKSKVKEGGTAHIHPQLTVKGVGFDRQLGGLEMELRLRDHLAKIFESRGKTKNSIYDSPRAMAKLHKEAKRVKQVLSANVDHTAQVEGLLDDIDFSAKVTRVEFEELCADLFERIGTPIHQALKMSQITMQEIESVIIVGGGTRVPKVQEEILEAVEKSELGKNLNFDEAAALGAVYQGAALSKLFRVKKFIVKDANVYPIQVSFDKHNQNAEGESYVKKVTRTIFNSGNPYPQKKVLTFNKYSGNFNFSVFYGEMKVIPEREQGYVGPLNLSTINLEGVMEARDSHLDGTPAGVKAHFRMDESGILILDSVESTFEYPNDYEQPSTFSKIKSAFTNLFGSEESEKKEGTNITDSKETKEEKEQSTDDNGPSDSNRDDSSHSDDSDTDKEEDTGDDNATGEANDSKDTVDENYGNKDNGDKNNGDGDNGDDDNGNKDNGDKNNGDGDNGDDDNGDGDDNNGDKNNNDENNGDGDNGDSENDDESDGEGDNSDGDNGDSENGDESDGEGDNGDGDNGDSDGEEADKSTENEMDDDDDDMEETDNNGEEEITDTDDTDTPTEEPPTDVPTEELPTGAPEEEQPTKAPSNKTTKAKKKLQDSEEKAKIVSVNLTSVITQLDMADPDEKQTDNSVTKLRWLQEKDEAKRENEKAKNTLESHIFETQDQMYSEDIMTISTEEEREVVLTALREAGEWMEDEGYTAETEVYTQKFKELRRASRPLFRRLREAKERPVLVARLKEDMNLSLGFLLYIKNISDDQQVLTKVEIDKMETLLKETYDWFTETEKAQNATAPHEDPVMLVSELEDKTKELEREMAYLINKIKTHPPKKPKTSTNSTNTTSSKKTNATDEAGDTPTQSTDSEDNKTPEDNETPSDSETPDATPTDPTEDNGTEDPEVLALPDTADSNDSTNDKEEL